jgi:hypothetical protein
MAYTGTYWWSAEENYHGKTSWILEFPMVSIPKITRVIFYHLVLCLSLSNVTQADEYRKFDLCAEIPGRHPDPVKCGEKTQQGLHTLTGEILHINGANLLLKKTNGEEVLLHIDLSTQMNGRISPGTRIEASVNDVEGEKHVLSLNKTK